MIYTIPKQPLWSENGSCTNFMLQIANENISKVIIHFSIPFHLEPIYVYINFEKNKPQRNQTGPIIGTSPKNFDHPHPLANPALTNHSVNKLPLISCFSGDGVMNRDINDTRHKAITTVMKYGTRYVLEYFFKPSLTESGLKKKPLIMKNNGI